MEPTSSGKKKASVTLSPEAGSGASETTLRGPVKKEASKKKPKDKPATVDQASKGGRTPRGTSKGRAEKSSKAAEEKPRFASAGKERSRLRSLSVVTSIASHSMTAGDVMSPHRVWTSASTGGFSSWMSPSRAVLPSKKKPVKDTSPFMSPNRVALPSKKKAVRDLPSPRSVKSSLKSSATAFKTPAVAAGGAAVAAAAADSPAIADEDGTQQGSVPGTAQTETNFATAGRRLSGKYGTFRGSMHESVGDDSSVWSGEDDDLSESSPVKSDEEEEEEREVEEEEEEAEEVEKEEEDEDEEEGDMEESNYLPPASSFPFQSSIHSLEDDDSCTFKADDSGRFPTFDSPALFGDKGLGLAVEDVVEAPLLLPPPPAAAAAGAAATAAGGEEVAAPHAAGAEAVLASQQADKGWIGAESMLPDTVVEPGTIVQLEEITQEENCERYEVKQTGEPIATLEGNLGQEENKLVIAALESKVAELLEVTVSLNAQIEELASEKGRLLGVVEGLKGEKAELAALTGTLNSQVEALTLEMSRLGETVEVLKKDKEGLSQSLQQSASLVADKVLVDGSPVAKKVFAQACAELSEELAKVRSEQDAAAAELRRVRLSHAAQIEDLKEEIGAEAEDLRAQMQKAKESHLMEVKALENKLAEAQQRHLKEAKELEEAIKRAEPEKCEDLLKRLCNLQERHEQLEQENEALKVEVQKLQARISEQQQKPAAAGLSRFLSTGNREADRSYEYLQLSREVKKLKKENALLKERMEQDAVTASMEVFSILAEKRMLEERLKGMM